MSGGRGHVYDAIVVGSGITGGWAAKELCERELKVLLLERGRNVEHLDYPASPVNASAKATADDRMKFPVQSRHYSFTQGTKHWFIDDLENPYTEVQPYDWIRGDIVGGRSLFWARQCYRWSDLDFAANAKDGIAVDWPIRYQDLAPWYDHVESFIGVDGQTENLSHLPDGKFQPPMEMTWADRLFKSRIEEAFPDRCSTLAQLANLTVPVKGRGVCRHRGRCQRGCPDGAYVSTNASTLPAAFATGNLTLEAVHDLLSSIVKNAKCMNCRLVLSRRSAFFHRRRDCSIQAKERSTIQPCGMTAKVCSSLRLATCTVAPNFSCTAMAKGSPV